MGIKIHLLYVQHKKTTPKAHNNTRMSNSNLSSVLSGHQSMSHDKVLEESCLHDLSLSISIDMVIIISSYFNYT